MSIKHSNHGSKRCSLLHRALEYIKDTLAFRNQWMHLQKRGNTPNYHYLKSGAKDRRQLNKGLSNASNIKPSEAEEPLESEPMLNSGALFEPLPIQVGKHNAGEPTATELHQDSECARHDSEGGIVDPCPVPREQIEKSLSIVDTADAKNQLFFESVSPLDSISNRNKGITLKPLDGCSGEIQEVSAATYGFDEESEHLKGLKEAVSSPKRSLKNRGTQAHGQVRRDQMQLPFE